LLKRTNLRAVIPENSGGGSYGDEHGHIAAGLNAAQLGSAAPAAILDALAQHPGLVASDPSMRTLVELMLRKCKHGAPNSGTMDELREGRQGRWKMRSLGESAASLPACEWGDAIAMMKQFLRDVIPRFPSVATQEASEGLISLAVAAWVDGDLVSTRELGLAANVIDAYLAVGPVQVLAWIQNIKAEPTSYIQNMFTMRATAFTSSGWILHQVLRAMIALPAPGMYDCRCLDLAPMVGLGLPVETAMQKYEVNRQRLGGGKAIFRGMDVCMHVCVCVCVCFYIFYLFGCG
jgi:hypothetical protein